MNRKKVRIVCLGAKALPFAGGIEGVLTEVAPRLTALGYEITVYVRSRYAGKPFESTYYGEVRLVSLPCFPGKHLEAPSHTLLSLFHALLTGADIFFFHAVVLGFFTIIPKLFGKKVVLETHGLDWKREKWGHVAKQLIKVSAHAAAVLPDATLCVSATDARFFEQEYGKRFPVVLNGVTPPIINDDQDFISQLGLRPQNYVLFMSRLVPEKGCHLLLKAWKSLAPEYRGGMKLVIAGGTAYEDKYYYSLKSQAREDILFPGVVSGTRKAQLLTHGLVFVQPSTVEGLSLALLEAMSYGLYPLVSDIEENLDAVGSDHATSFKVGNSADLSEKLSLLLADPDRLISLRPEISNWVAERYNWDTVTERIATVLDAIL